MGAVPGESRNPFDVFGPDATLEIRRPGEINIIPSEHPRHLVEMDIRYAIGRNEVTYAEWMACLNAGGCTHNPDHKVLTPNGNIELGPQHPVINVSFLDAQEYVSWLNRVVGKKVYRLPTEAEWEFAARAGNETRFAQGNKLTSDQANFSRKATEHLRGDFVSLPELKNRWAPVPVDELDASNSWGLRHMAGNVLELTMSCWSDEHLGLAKNSEYLALARKEGVCRRVAKGGAFDTAMDGLRHARRIRPTEDYRRNFLGFRIIRELD